MRLFFLFFFLGVLVGGGVRWCCSMLRWRFWNYNHKPFIFLPSWVWRNNYSFLEELGYKRISNSAALQHSLLVPLLWFTTSVFSSNGLPPKSSSAIPLSPLPRINQKLPTRESTNTIIIPLPLVAIIWQKEIQNNLRVFVTIHHDEQCPSIFRNFDNAI